MNDHAHDIRQRFINSAPSSLSEKVAALRWEMHKQGKALLGEEVLAQRWNLKAHEYKPADTHWSSK